MGFYADGAARLAVAVPLQGGSVVAGAQQANFPQVGQLQALGSFAAGWVVGVSGHDWTVRTEVAEIFKEDTAASLPYQHQLIDLQVLRHLTKNPDFLTTVE